MMLPIRNVFPTARVTMPPKSEIPDMVPQKLTGIRGLGDVVAMVANPIKKAALAVANDEWKKRIQNCGCAQRQEWLNKQFPFNKGKT